jgi:hypothetical protein
LDREWRINIRYAVSKEERIPLSMDSSRERDPGWTGRAGFGKFQRRFIGRSVIFGSMRNCLDKPAPGSRRVEAWVVVSRNEPGRRALQDMGRKEYFHQQIREKGRMRREVFILI